MPNPTMAARVPFLSLFLLFLLSPALADDDVEHVLTLDASNFTDTVSKHPFIVVEFYAPWCGHCKSLAPEYEKAAAALSSQDPPIILAKVDANDEKNKELASEFEIRGFPTLKILRKGGKSIQEYKGPRESDGIIEYLKKQAGPESVEIKSSDDASSIIDSKKIFIAGIFPQLSGEEFENFTAVADKLRSDYDFGHTVDAKNLPQGDTTVKGPLIRLLKPFDEMFVDFQDFNVYSLEKLVEEASIPIVTIFNKEPENHPYVTKFFNSPNAKVMLFLNFSGENFETYNSKYHDSASKLKGRGFSFLIGDTEVSQSAFQYFGLKEEQVPLIIILKGETTKYLKPNLKPEEIAPWLEEYLEGKLQAFRKSEPIPEFNNEPVKVVVADSLQDFVFKSGKNVLLEFYAPWCGHCKKLAPILDEVAVSFEDEKDVIIAKIDATANDYPSETFDVKGYPTLYFVSATGKVEQYEGDRSKDDIISFILKSKEGASPADLTAESVKDEL